MAESAVSFLLENVSALLVQEANLLYGVRNQIRSVRNEFELIRSFLGDAEQKRHKHKRVTMWLNHIRDVAYDMEDIIDTYIFKVEQRRQRRNIASRFIFFLSKITAIHTVGNQIKEIKERLEEISANKTKYLSDIELVESSSSKDMMMPKERRAPIVEEDDVVGFKKDAEELAKALLTAQQRGRAVVSIVSMGGLGKTTLAKNVYNRMDVKNGFQIRAWVYVSQEYRVRDLLLSTIKQVMIPSPTKEQLEEMNEEQLEGMLAETLQGKRYLVVFDDIWKTEAWDLLAKAFPDDCGDGRIMLTTRNRDVALQANPSIPPHELRFLNETESWELFLKKVFRVKGNTTSFPTDQLEPLGKKIVAKAGGLPLAIIVLGGLLSTKEKTPLVWQKVLDSADWHLIEGSNQCPEVLALSYRDLPYYLKSCFLYFGMYPEDVEIRSVRLIRLWVAEGFIQERRDQETMEDVAEDYLEELIQRSMVMVERRHVDGKVRSCRIHDLLRDLAISEAKQDRFLRIYGSHYSISTESGSSRRFTVHPGKGKYHSDHLQHSMENLRSLLLCFSTESLDEKDIWRPCYGNVKLLRVLDLYKQRGIKKLPKEIGELVLLKYLGLSQTGLKVLPDSIGNLLNLQTLDVRFAGIRLIPCAIQKLHQLRHLIWGSGEKCDVSVFLRIDHLRHLQTIDLVAGTWIKGGLEKLANLRSLSIDGNLSPYSKVLSYSLSKLYGLRSLDLFDGESSTPLPLVPFSQHINLTRLILWGTLQKLPNIEEFPPNLVQLYLTNSNLKENNDPMATLEKLPNLRFLSLNETYEGKMMTCSAGGFANLRDLQIDSVENLEEWKVEEGAMSNLRSLKMSHCKRLKKLPDWLKHISTLKEVDLGNLPERLHQLWQQSGTVHHGDSPSGGGDGEDEDNVTTIEA